MLVNIDEKDLHLILKGLYTQTNKDADLIAQKILSQVNVHSSLPKIDSKKYSNIELEDGKMDEILKNEEETLKILDSMITKKNQILRNSKLIN
jgi:hypothetical protein